MAEIGISVRSFSPAVRALLKKRITDIISGIAQAHDTQADIQYIEGYPVLINTPEAVDLAAEVARDLGGPDAVELEHPQITGSEDFATCSRPVPERWSGLAMAHWSKAEGCTTPVMTSTTTTSPMVQRFGAS